MLREDGFVHGRRHDRRACADERFFMTTTTAQRGARDAALEFCHQVLWPELDVQIVSVSEQWAQFSIAGPRSRDVLRKLVDEKFDLADKALPYLAAREITVGGGIAGAAVPPLVLGRAGLRARPFRRATAMRAIRAIMAAGDEFGITPYGTEALGVMRIEKGHVAGNEINGAAHRARSRARPHDVEPRRITSAA